MYHQFSGMFQLLVVSCVCMQPAPLSETVDHTVEEEAGELPQKAFQNPSTPLSPYPSLTLSSPASSGEDDDSEEEDDMNNRSDLRLPIGHTQHKPSSDWSTELCGCKFIVWSCVGEQLGQCLAEPACVVERVHGWSQLLIASHSIPGRH